MDDNDIYRVCLSTGVLTVIISQAAIHGVAREIPLDLIFLVTSEDGLEWKQRRHAIETAVDRIDSDTVMVMKSLKYETFARFVRIVLPPFDKRMKVGEEMPGYKVELFHCLNTGSVWHRNTVPSPIGLGIESGAIPDSQFTSTSQLSLEYGAQFSRLNSRTGGGAWCAASCDPSVYLQIDLGRVLLIRELDVQSKHDDSGGTNTVLSFFLENSADGASWEYYKANGANKLFLGSTLRNLAIRHKLLIPVNARFVRFRPKTCINQACMRAELYFYPDFGKFKC
ncbi:epithelial discoidin domain-containing receptor 1-like [Pocillopora damicornis]|uniref:epithelial discoidin domain-containing receptor 1-like n=1 Tax=Pocillopora damicornis TaxID=46731 RepID=UPI000F556682|nr:epithelial discoidin domain-containing receptor 1-like [Pocillopora damicornis]